MFRCAWLPADVGDRCRRCSATRLVGVAVELASHAAPGRCPLGIGWSPASRRALQDVRVGRQLGDRRACAPARRPARRACGRSRRGSARAPRRSGSAKLTRPSPPNVVPSSENSAWFWLIGRSWPLHSAQPLGAKTKLMIRISDRNGSAISSSTHPITRLAAGRSPIPRRSGRRWAGRAAHETAARAACRCRRRCPAVVT